MYILFSQESHFPCSIRQPMPSFPPNPGFEVLIVRKRGLLIEPIIAWSIETETVDTENIRHGVLPITPEGDMANYGKLPWGIRRPGGVIEYGGQYFSRATDF